MPSSQSPTPRPSGNDNYSFNFLKDKPPSLDDFICSDELKSELQAIATQMQFAPLFFSLHVPPDRAFLFHGAPGTGKTFAVDCLHGEAIKRGTLTGKIDYDIGKYGSIYINENSTRLDDLFRQSEKLLSQTKVQSVIVLFDECDVILENRANQYQHKEDRKMLETLMKNLQYIHNSQLPLFVFFTTNYTDILDEASIRAGRLDKSLLFPLPDLQVREKLFQHTIQSYNQQLHYQFITPHYKALAKVSEGLNHQDVVDVVRRASKRTLIDEVSMPARHITRDVRVTTKYILHEIDKLKQAQVQRQGGKIGFK